MTDSQKALKSGIEGTLVTAENTELQTETQEEDTKELFLDLQPLHTIGNGKTIRVPKNQHFTRKDVVTAFQSAFELIGGVPRLALWAHEHETEFYKLYSRLLPSQASSALGESNELKIRMEVAPGPLDQGDS